MKYQEEYAKAMLTDKRYVGAITEKMVRVWKTRDSIPNQYFNAKFVKLMKEGKEELANQVYDKYFNDAFTLRIEASDEEKKEHDRIITVFQCPKIIMRQVFLQVGLNTNLYIDAIRKDTKRVDISPANIIKLKTNIVELRSKMKKVLLTNSGKTRFSERDKEEIDRVVQDTRLANLPFMLANKTYSDRTTQRRAGKFRSTDDSEYIHYMQCISMFLLETQV